MQHLTFCTYHHLIVIFLAFTLVHIESNIVSDFVDIPLSFFLTEIIKEYRNVNSPLAFKRTDRKRETERIIAVFVLTMCCVITSHIIPVVHSDCLQRNNLLRYNNIERYSLGASITQGITHAL